jgi:trehalose 6-phosphate phosphatase
MRSRIHVPEPLDVAHVLDARRARGLVAVFDLDGTLAPIAPTPAAARLPAATRRVLLRLTRRSDTLVGLVSGRPLAELERFVPGSRLWLAGLHGAVRRPPGARERRLWSRDTARQGARLAETLSSTLGAIRGVMIEPKGPMVAVHVRAASPAARTHAFDVVSAVRPPTWKLLEGRRVIELRPPGLPTKGDAVRWLASQRPDAAILYVGDDATDEDAFRALRRTDFPVLVDAGRARRERGRSAGATAARWSLHGPDDVRRVLERLAAPRIPGRD